jgi:hypothetical protein
VGWFSDAPMTTMGATPAAGVDHPVAHALVDALTLLRPVADPGEIRLWQLGDDQCLTTMLTIPEASTVTVGAHAPSGRMNA